MAMPFRNVEVLGEGNHTSIEILGWGSCVFKATTIFISFPQ